MRSLHHFLGTFGLVLVVSATACSPSPVPFNRDVASIDGQAGMDGSDVHTSNIPDGRPDIQYVFDTQEDDVLLNADAACAVERETTTREPLNLLILLDRSGSMSQSGKWDGAVEGINALLDALGDNDLVGLTLFPTINNASTESAYRTPAVAVGPLSTTRSRIRTLLNNQSPDSGGTPMACGLVGSQQYFSMDFALPGSRNIMLITDGAPTEECSGTNCGLFDINCQLNASNQAKIRIQTTVAQGARSTPQIRTFVLGTADADNAFLSNLAILGGTQQYTGCGVDQSCHYSLSTANFGMDLQLALNDIRGRTVTCEFRINADPTTIDPNLTNVNYYSSPGVEPTVVPRDTTHTDGWDWSDDGSSVILHGPKCDELRNNTSNGSVEVLVGCPTIFG